MLATASARTSLFTKERPQIGYEDTNCCQLSKYKHPQHPNILSASDEMTAALELANAHAECSIEWHHIMDNHKCASPDTFLKTQLYVVVEQMQASFNAKGVN